MNDFEDLMEAILRGQLGDKIDQLPKIELWQHRQAILELLIPAAATLNRMKADAWEEGYTAGQNDEGERLSISVARPSWTETSNPYKEA